jgi:DNA-binding NarL/FixJ family response regulator
MRTSREKLKILIANDHAVVVEGLRRILDRPEHEVVGVANNGQALLQAAAELQPDVIITDVAMPCASSASMMRSHKA